MSEKQHPYASSGAVTAAVNQFRKSFPDKVAADTLRKLSIAPNNESYVINVLRFVGAINNEGSKTQAAIETFNHHEDEAFQASFGKMVKSAYKELFQLHSDGAWSLNLGQLISFFRQNDRTSDLVGRRQASTFQALATLAGHSEPSAPAKQAKKKEAKPTPSNPKSTLTPVMSQQSKSADGTHQRDVGLTVRVEVNLPAAADQETYDRIFRSIRENLLNAK